MIFLIVMVYSRASTSTLALLTQVYSCVCGGPCVFIELLQLPTGRLSSAVITFTLESEANEDPPEFTLTCQSRGGPVTEVEWRRNGVRVEEDSNHMTSQIIVDTSRNTVYNNTLRVRGRESGTYACTVRNNAQDFFPDSDIRRDQATGTLVVRGKSLISTTSLLVAFNTETQAPINLTATYKSTMSVLLEWTFPQPPSTDLNYVVYYQSGGVSYSESFSLRRDSETIRQLNDIPAGGIHSISLVAMRQGLSVLAYLPSPVAGPVDPGMFWMFL